MVPWRCRIRFRFFANVGTVIMGRRIYGQITTELSPYMWPYSGAMTYVLTHNAPMADTVNNLQEGTGKSIRICGGADVIIQLMKKALTDRCHIVMIPLILGGGIRVFDEIGRMINLTLVDTMNYKGVVEVVYDSRKVTK